MKSIFILNIFILFFLTSIKSTFTLSVDELESIANGNCIIDKFREPISIETTENINKIELKKCEDEYNNYEIKLNVEIPETKYDLLDFELVDEYLEDPKISFFLSESGTEAFIEGDKNIQVKISDIISGNYYIKIYFGFNGTLDNFTLKHSFSNYQNTKRLEDNDEYVLNTGNKQDIIYEYGLSQDKKILFKVLGNGINDFIVKYQINNKINTISKSFFNGYSLLIDNSIFKSDDKTIKFYFENYKEKLNILTSLQDNTEKKINNKNNHFDIHIVDTSQIFNIDLSIKNSDKYIFKFTTYTKNIKAIFTDGKNNQDTFEINEESTYYILDSTRNYKKVTFAKSGNKDFAALSFDVLKLENNNNFKVIRGLPQRNILYNGMTAIYKPEIYSSESKNEVINSHIIKGKFSFSITKNNLALSDIDIPIINGYASYKNKIEENNPIYAKVTCLNDECVFDIEMKGAEEITYFKKDYKVFSLLDNSNSDKYQIDIKDIESNNYLLINVYYLKEKPDVTIDNFSELNTYKTDLTENVLYYNIPIEILKNVNPENIIINISTNKDEGIYYGISYEITKNNNEMYLEKNTVYIINLDTEINQNNFKIKQDSDSKLIINANSFSNNLTLTLDDKSYTSKNNLIYIELNETSVEEYALKIKRNIAPKNKYMNLYIYEPSIDTKILIQEGNIYNNRLTKENSEINYLIYLPNDAKYLFNFRKYSMNDVKITINNILQPISKLSELINFETKCSDKNCEVLIKIETDNKENAEADIDFNFEILKFGENINLYKNIFTSGVLEKDNEIKYSGIYEYNDEILVDFLEGEGEAFLTMRFNDDSGKEKNFDFDYYNKKFNINEISCYKNNCNFTLTLKYTGDNINAKYKYNVLLKDRGSSILIPPFETIYGELIGNLFPENKYSIIKMGNFHNYELDCDFCILEEESNNEDDDEIKFSIKIPKGISEAYYNFRINFYNEENIILYHLNSVRNHHYCEISKTNPCYYLAFIENYNDIDNLTFLAQNGQNVIINLKKFNNGEKEQDIYTKIKKGEITQYDITSKHYLEFTNVKDSNGYYILLVLNSDDENKLKVNLVYDMFKRNYSSMKNIYKDDFCLINSDMNIDLINVNDEYNILDLNLLTGNNKFEVDIENKKYYLEKGFKDNLNLFSSLDKNYTIPINVKSTESIIYYRKIKYGKKANIKEIYFGKSNYLSYENQLETSYFSYYINLNDVNIVNEDIHLNYKLLNIPEQNYPDDIKIEIFLVNKDYIINEKEGLGNNNLAYINITNITYYQKDMGAGYALLNKNKIIDENNPYLFIKINEIPKQELDLAITVTDFSANYDMPKDIYLFMLIKNEKDFEIKQNIETAKIPFVEISNENNLKVNYDNTKLDSITKNGKTIFALKTKEKTFNFKFTINSYESINIPNLLIKYGFSSSKDEYSYFNIKDSSITYDDATKLISFYQSETSELNYSIIYNILIYKTQILYDSFIEKTKPIISIKHNESKSSSEVIKIDLTEALNNKFGKYYINILTEGKLKNEAIDNYEYLLYKYSEIRVTSETLETEITITENKQDRSYDCTNNVKINATVSLYDSEITQYKFIKLVIIDYNEAHRRQKFEIYASTQESFYNVLKKNLYKESEYKSIDSFNNTVLAIPLNENTAKKIYINIPCKDQCDFHLQYRIEDGRKMEGITIHENTCFDILLENIISTDSQINNNYRFVYTINKTNVPLITLTTDDINNDYELFTSGSESETLKKTFYNGYSFLFYYSDDYYEYHTFMIKPNITTLFKICHRIIGEEKNEERRFRPISVGENIYSAIKNKMYSLKDCFEIENEENYEQYMFNYISKTQNVKLVIYNEGTNTSEFYYLFDETGTIFFDSSNVKQFCLELRGDGELEKVTYADIFGAVNFQLLGIKNNKITQNLNAPLINGFSIKHTLQKGQMIYYRLNRYKVESIYLEMYFQSLSGDIALNRSKCYNYPDCSFSPDKFDNIINYYYKNYFYDEQELEDNEKDIYNKEYFSVYIVYCDRASKEDCSYYLGMNNENSTLELNEKRKYYFNLTKEKTFYFSTDFYQEKYNKEYINNDPRKYYFEVHSFQGDFNKSNISINNDNNTSLYNYDNKTYYYATTSYRFLVGEFYYLINKITAEKNTLFYITYRSILLLYYEGKITDNFYYMYENEMHYNLLGPANEDFTYYYPEADTSKDIYVASLSGINSYINDISKYSLYILDRNYTNIKCYLEDYNEKLTYQCEFIFSFAKLVDNTIKKNIEFDGFYQYYVLNDVYGDEKEQEYENFDEKNLIKNVYLRYNLTEKELMQEKVFVTIKKLDFEDLTIYYGFNTEDNFKNFKDIIKKNDMFRINLQELINENNNKKNDFNQNNYLMFKLTSKESTEFKIKINIKNVPTYLSLDDSEYGSLMNDEFLYYYFNYFPAQTKDTPENYEEVILYNKGNVRMKAALLKNSKDYPYNTYDMYEIIANEESYFDYYDIDSENNHIKLLNKNRFCSYGCLVYIKVYLNGSDENANGNYNLFSIYRHSQNGVPLLVESNNNIFGNFYSDGSETYYFFTSTGEMQGNLIVNLDCQKCKMHLSSEYSGEEIDLTNSYIFDKSSSFGQGNYIIFDITGEKGYYFFSFTDSSLPKYIEESIPELCYGSCKFVFPLYNYYNYIKNETKQTQIIFYSPDFEQINIGVELVDKSEIDTFPLEDFDLINITEIQNDENNKFRNRLFYDLNTDEILQKEKYLRIHVVSEDNNKIFNFIMSKFISSINTNTIKYRKQIISLKQRQHKKNIMTINNEGSDNFYKISLSLISGAGTIYLDEEEIYQYYLNYEHRPSISVIIKLENYNISALNLNNDKNFTFFINVTKLDKYENIEEQFDNHQVYKIKYIIDEKEKSDIFPLNFKVPFRKGYTAFISYRFIELEHYENDEYIHPKNKIYNSTFVDFYADLNDHEKNPEFNTTNFESTYYPDFQRGIIKINSDQDIELDYVHFILNKSKDNKAKYKTLFLEVAPIFINNEKDEKIYIPKNAYVQFDLNRINHIYNLSFYEQDPEYINYQIDLANSTFVNITNENEFNFDKKSYLDSGKSILLVNNLTESREKLIQLYPNSPVTVLVKYFTKKSLGINEYIHNFILNKITIEWDPHDNSTIYNITQNNIEPEINSNITDYTISYFTRLYSYLSIYEGNEVMSILIPFNGNMSFNIDFDKNYSKNESFNYTLNFGNISREMYYINFIGAVKLYDSIEYFSYVSQQFRLYLNEPTFFEKKWFIPLVFVLLVLCCVIAFSIFINIKEYKQKKKNKKEGDDDALINNIELKKDAENEEEKEEDKDDENEKEDDNDEDDDDDNKIKI